MRRVILAIASTVTALVLLLGFKTHTTSTSTAATPPAAVASPTATAAPSTSAGVASGPAGGTTTVLGAATDTRYGPVQVQVTVTNGKVTAVAAVVYPNDNPRDQQINSYAVPQLNQEATAAKTAHIDTVSGATYTSDGYITSLQSALDKARVA